MKILPEKETVWSWLYKSTQALWTIFELPPMEKEDPYPKIWSVSSKQMEENSVRSIWSDRKNGKDVRPTFFDDSSLPDLRSIDDTLN
jgi:hypothetical protein